MCLWYDTGMAQRVHTNIRLSSTAVDWMDTLAHELSTPKVRVTRTDVIRGALALALADEPALRRTLARIARNRAEQP